MMPAWKAEYKLSNTIAKMADEIKSSIRVKPLSLFFNLFILRKGVSQKIQGIRPICSFIPADANDQQL